MLSLLGSRSSSPWVSMHGDRISAVCVGNDEQMASRVTQAWQLWEHAETPFPISILMKTCRMVTYQWHINARQKGRLSSDPQGPPTPQKSTSYSRTPPSKDPRTGKTSGNNGFKHRRPHGTFYTQPSWSLSQNPSAHDNFLNTSLLKKDTEIWLFTHV